MKPIATLITDLKPGDTVLSRNGHMTATVVEVIGDLDVLRDERTERDRYGNRRWYEVTLERGNGRITKHWHYKTDTYDRVIHPHTVREIVKG